MVILFSIDVKENTQLFKSVFYYKSELKSADKTWFGFE